MGEWKFTSGHKFPTRIEHRLRARVGWPEERVRIVGQLMGGGFGGKEDIMGQIHVALLANVTERPVKLLFDRHESLLVHPKRHATQIRVKIGAMKNGRLVAVETELYGDTGAYASLGEKVMTRATTHSAGPYDVQHVRADCYAMYTNNPPAGAFRGFGVTQSAFAVESMMDMLAEKLGIDRIDLRRMNALHVGSITNTGQELNESVGLTECIDRVVREMRKSEPAAVQAVSIPETRIWCAPGALPRPTRTPASAAAHPINPARTWNSMKTALSKCAVPAAELGQGLVTVMRLIVSEEMAVPPDKVRVLVMDTDLTPNGGPTTASRQTYVTGNASRYAAKSACVMPSLPRWLRNSMCTRADPIRRWHGPCQRKEISYAEVAKEMKAMGQQPRALYEYEAPKTQPLGTGGDMHFAFSFGVQAAEVEVNTLTGEVRVLNVISANDVGMAVNPLGLQGQVEGGVMMGLGNCLTEEFIMDDGNVVTDHLARYRVPGIMLTPEITAIIVEHPTAEGPYGAKGVGEICSIPTTPAITNAIYNAVGVRVDKTPVDQELIARALWEKP